MLSQAERTQTFERRNDPAPRPVNGKGDADQIAIWSNGQRLTGSEDLIWDDAAGKLVARGKPLVPDVPRDGRVYARQDRSWVALERGGSGGSGSSDDGSGEGIPGPAGPQGEPGEPGPAGPVGEPGPEGPEGPAGADGAVGPEGPAGATGETGSQGPAGAVGATGAKGDTGDAGAQGVQGIQGVPGSPGAPGATGPAGSPDTPAQVLAKLITVDGAGSGLDADLFDGADSALFARLASPAFSGDPTAPTPGVNDNDVSIATTAFVKSAIAAAGAGQIFYFDPTDVADVATYKRLLLSPSPAVEVAVPVTCSGTGDVLIGSFITDPGVPGAVDYPAGSAYRRLYGSVSAGIARFHLQIYIRTAAGAETLVRDEFSDNFSNTTVALQEWLATPSSGGALAVTDRIVNKIYAQRVSGPTTITVTFYAEGAAHASQVQTTISAAASVPVSVTPPLAMSGGNISIDLSAYAPLASPVLTGNPTAPTPTAGDNDTSIATTAFVTTALAAKPGGASISDTAPSSPVVGQFWWESDTGNTFIWYNDGSSSQWVQTNVSTAVNDRLVSVPADMSALFATSPNRFVINDKPDGSGTDVASISDAGAISAASLTATGGITAASLAVTGGITAASVTATGGSGFISNQVFQSSNVNVIVGPTGAGTVYLRPNGVASATGQMTVASSGAAVSSGSISAPSFEGGHFNTGLNVAVNVSGNFRGKNGISVAGGGYSGNMFALLWNSAATVLFVDNTNLGTINTTSDYRIKKDIAELPSTWDRVKALRPISYTQAEFTPPMSPETEAALPDEPEFRPSLDPVFKEDDIERWGFIAHETQKTLLMAAASGHKDMVDGVQGLNWGPILAATVRALQEAMARIETLQDAVAKLEAARA